MMGDPASCLDMDTWAATRFNGLTINPWLILLGPFVFDLEEGDL